MKSCLLSHSRSPRLIMLFAGWASDPRLFRGLSHDGYDLLVVWDYTDETLDAALDGYEEICVLGWSYGVYFAGRFIGRHRSLPITARVAVNGTMHPIDSDLGIAPEMFSATLDSLSYSALAKFYRRMCGGAARMSRAEGYLPERTLDSVRGELAAIGERYAAEGAPDVEWDYAFISRNDLIFPPDSQRRAWSGKAEIVELDEPHYPDFSRVLAKAFIRKAGVAEAFSRSADTYDSNAPAQYRVAQSLADMIEQKLTIAGRVVEIGPGSGFLSRRITENSGIDELTLIDVSPIGESLPGGHIVGDAEIVITQMADASVDAIVSSSAVQWFNSPRHFIRQAHRVLTPGGVLAISVYGSATFSEIEGLSSPSRVFTIDELKRLAEPMFDIVELSEMSITQSFTSPLELLRHFRLTGVAPANPGAGAVSLAKQLVSNNVTTLTYNPIFLLITKKFL